MLPNRHCAYDITTGEILCCDCGNQLKRSVILTKKVNKEMEQGVQGMEMQLNTVGSSRGDYPKQFGCFFKKKRLSSGACCVCLKIHLEMNRIYDNR